MGPRPQGGAMQRQNDLARCFGAQRPSRNTLSLCELEETGGRIGWEWKMLSPSPKTKAATAARILGGRAPAHDHLEMSAGTL